MRTIGRLLVMVVLVGSTSLWAADGDLPGSGTEADPYLIEDLADFDAFADSVNAATYWARGVYTRLACDPNMAGRTYTTAVIAPDTDNTKWPWAVFDGPSFSGVFDGDGHVISNLTIDAAGAGNDYLGLFGDINGSSAEVKNLGVEKINITGGAESYYLGGLCGWNFEGTITNCYAGGLVNGGDTLGGLCGFNREGTITNCYATGSVNGGRSSDSLGGLCGYNWDGTITNCYATGSVTGGDSSRFLGGLCGLNYEGTITNCYAGGSVTGGDSSRLLGGLCGQNSTGTITNCYAGGLVNGGDTLGGLCGQNSTGTITNCYAVGLVTGGDGSYVLGGLCGYNGYGMITNCYYHLLSGPANRLGTILDDLQMQEAGSFAGFDFAGNSSDGEDDHWTIVNGHCPKLTWQTDDGPLVPGPPATTLSGSGYWHDPFQINSYADFTEFRTNNGLRGGYYILTTDIDLSGDTFATAVVNGLFGGHFDGSGHVISNVTIDAAGEDNSYLGLFSRITASVSSLGIENINITGGAGSMWLGGLCGYNDYGTITNCYATGSITGGDDSDYLGGLCGQSSTGTITNCYATGSVTGGNDSEHLGGLCGYNGYGMITNCYVTGSVTGGHDSERLGGLCGQNSTGTITNCYATGSVTGGDSSRFLGGLCGQSSTGTITNCYATGSVTGGNDSEHLGGLCGNYGGKLDNCYASGSVTGGNDSDRLGGLCGHAGGTISNCYSSGSVTGKNYLGGLCGYNTGSIANCYATGSVAGGDGSYFIGGLCGKNTGSITNCYSGGSVTGRSYLGGLCGGSGSLRSPGATITNCYSGGSVTGGSYLGGLVGQNDSGTITNCYSGGSVTGGSSPGGLCGVNMWGGTITNCYATGSVTGGDDSYNPGGLCGYNHFEGPITNCFWDIETGGPDNGLGTPLPTEQMQTLSTFVDAGWDFTGETVNGIEDIWFILQGDYPRLWWAFVPVLHTEPEITLGTNNTISWEPVAGAIEYYLECAGDEDFTGIVYDSGWITETSCEFIDLQTGQQYWYRVKAGNAAGVETGWSNVVSSLQSTLGDAVDMLLDPGSLKNENMKNALLNKIDAAMGMIDEGNYTGALSKLEHDILAKTNGCAETGEPDKNDWILTCEQQSRVYGLVMETIEYVRSLME